MLGARPAAASRNQSSKPVPAAASKKPEVVSPTATKIDIPAPEAKKRPVLSSKRGKAIQFYLHTEDEKLIREFFVWLAPHRKRVNDSLVIKTVLRAAKTGPDFLAAYDKAVKVDGRIIHKG